MLVGASGGAKWLALTGIDRYILEEMAPRFDTPVHLLGSSIGCWRFACYAHPQPLQALNQFRDGYIDEQYGDKPTAADISRIGELMLRRMLGESNLAAISHSDRYRLHFMTVQAHHLTASERRLPLAIGLGLALTANAISRRGLRLCFTRALVSDARLAPPAVNARDLPMQVIALNESNLIPAIMASSAIPFVMQGVRDMPGARRGLYRDGGIIDYHFDVPLSCDDGITLYPHFFPRLTPGWFDKRRPSRQPKPQHLDRVVLIAPSDRFASQLPGGRIPDRSDFTTMPADERRQRWHRIVAECAQLGDALGELIQTQRLADVASPI